ncbi:TPA: hypothetical protein ACPHRY_002684 [Vibrio antiquarius]
MNPPITNRFTQAWVIEINGRFFYEFGKKGQVKTAWRIAGSEMFFCRTALKQTLSKLDDKKKNYTVKLVEVQEPNLAPLYSVREFYEMYKRIIRMQEKSYRYQTVDYQCAFHHARNSLVNQVLLLSTQFHMAYQSIDQETISRIDRFFADFGPQFNYDRLTLPLDLRLELHKERPKLRDSEFEVGVPF